MKMLHLYFYSLKGVSYTLCLLCFLVDKNIALIVGCAVGSFILLVIIIAVVIWCVRKNNNKDKDKRKKSKTSNKGECFSSILTVIALNV